jgi:hypothetical protein
MFILQTNAIKRICKTKYTNLVTIRIGIYVKSNNPIIYITKKCIIIVYE